MIYNSKALFWNIWGHRYADELKAFLKKHSDADVICLTEVTDVSKRQIEKNGHNLVFTGDEAAAQVDGLAQLAATFGSDRNIFYDTAGYRKWKCINTGTHFSRVGFGSALLVRNDLTIIKTGSRLINLNHKTIKDRVLQWIVYEKNSVRYLVAHLHGVWIRGNTKGDHELRDLQSVEVREQLRHIAWLHDVTKVIFGGDLNLDINTKALEILLHSRKSGDVRYENLIASYGVTNTRTRLYRSYGVAGHSQYADYVIVSDDVKVNSLQCLNDVLASDHAPLVVEFS